MKIIPTALEGIRIIEPDVFTDNRGLFMETYHQQRYRTRGIDSVFVQDNLSVSRKGTLRGLHYQSRHAQAKLVQVISGEIFDVAVDIRLGSPTFGKWEGVYLSNQNHRQLFIPRGFAHGFCVLSDTAHVMYKCSDFYVPEDEGGILWRDSGIGINWPMADPVISAKDEKWPCLRDVSPETLPRVEKMVLK